MTDAQEVYFATCAPGVEPVLHEEIRALGLARVERQTGGVRFEGTEEDGWRANLRLRTAVRVLRRVARFEARGPEDVYEGAAAVDWGRHVAPSGTLAVAAHTRDSALRHSGFVAQKVKDAIVDRLRDRHGVRPDVDREDPDLRVHVHLVEDRCTLFLDTSGESLHLRGWRRFQGRAPLAETLAAAIILLSGWDRRAPLLDPFCGSGTILIEASLIAADIAPGLFRRRFGFERWPDHDSARYARVKEAVRASARPAGKPVLRGWDREPAVIEGARSNIESAGLAGAVEVEVGGALEFAPRKGWNAWIVTNPPYGERVGEGEDLAATYRAFGDLLRERCGGFHLALLSGNARLDGLLGLAPERVVALRNGAIPCRLLLLEIPR